MCRRRHYSRQVSTLKCLGKEGKLTPTSRATNAQNAGIFGLTCIKPNLKQTHHEPCDCFSLEVVDVRPPELGGVQVGVSAKTVIGGKQFDRMGRPAINTVLIPSGQKDAFNAGTPANDYATFGATVEATIASLNGNDTVTAVALAGILLPDILTVDASSNAGFLTGRQPPNDVIDAELNLLTNGGVTTDMVNANDVPFLAAFPYLAVKH